MLFDFDLNGFVTGDFDGDGDFDTTDMVIMEELLTDDYEYTEHSDEYDEWD